MSVASQPRNAPEAVEHIVATLAPPAGDFQHIDVSSNYQGSEASLVLTTLDFSMLEQTIILSFKVSNNEVEYEALLAGIRLAKDLVEKKLTIYYDSQLITNQTPYLEKVRGQLATFQAYTLT